MRCLNILESLYHMSNIDVSKLKNNDNIRYIYTIPNSLFEDGLQYILIGDIKTDNENNVFCYSLDDWFSKMKAGDLLPYACATLKKKYKPKEYLNIYEKPDILKFRRYILNCNLSDWEVEQQLLWAMQILTEYKINRYDVFPSKCDFKALFSDFLSRVEGMVIQSISTS